MPRAGIFFSGACTKKYRRLPRRGETAANSATPAGARGLLKARSGRTIAMTSTTLAGKRCRTNKGVNGPAGRVEPMSEGKIRYVSENVGRLIVAVDWDNG